MLVASSFLWALWEVGTVGTLSFSPPGISSMWLDWAATLSVRRWASGPGLTNQFLP